MIESLKWRWVITLVVLVFGILYTLPNFVTIGEKSILPKKKLTMGLDIQGGIHLVMGVDVKTVVEERTIRMAKNLQSDFKDNNVGNVTATPIDNNSKISVSYASKAEADKIRDRISVGYPSMLQVLEDDGKALTISYYDAYVLQMKKDIVEQAIEVIRNRIDEFGVSEPAISAQGTDRILVQLPGLKDAASAKDLINRTAKLNFRVVSTEVPTEKLESLIKGAEEKGKYKLGVGGLSYTEYIKSLNTDLKADLPEGTRLVFEKIEAADSIEDGRRPFLVKTDSNLGGDQLEDASVKPDQYGKPEVAFQFSAEGRKHFAELTEKAAGGFIAIVLDDVVKSAPSVRERIDSDSAVITLGSSNYDQTLKEAQFIATSLRAGSLPAALTQLEERTVGPSLGGDSIKKGQHATLLACLFVFAFMLLYYRTQGLIADITLAFNLLLTLAGLSALGATLTLPGVAGLALTVGMAVDANIIIYERISEELAKGKNMLAAVKDGFGHAFAAIFDGHVTTLLTCVVLMYFGTGPIRGFAVSLTIGLVISMFTSVFVTRTMTETLVTKFGWNIKPHAASHREG